jgi:glycosyltransferase involved in cell wall biosynthesis
MKNAYINGEFRFYSIPAWILEALLLPFLAAVCLIIRLRTAMRRRRFFPEVFMGTMDINSWPYVAQALGQRRYRVSLVVWNKPAYERKGAPDEIVLSQRYPFLFRYKVTEYFVQFLLFLWAVWRHDIFITCFLGRLLDRTVLLRWVELPLLWSAGKKIILNTYGADVMTPRTTLGKRYKYSVTEGYMKDQSYAALNERVIKRNRDYGQVWADCIISAIDHVEYLDRVDEYFHMRCIDTARYVPTSEPANTIPVIIHAPNHRLLKGTEYLITAVNELNTEGIQCTLKIMEKRPHDEILEELAKADIAADQFLVGAYARFAIEAMTFCKPVLCYLREDLFQYNPIWKECPIINVNPDSLKEGMKRLVLMSSEQRADIGKKGRAYVEKYHSIPYVGERMDSIIREVWTRGSVTR